MQTIRMLLCGVGNVGRHLIAIIAARDALLRERYGLDLRVVGAVDSSGGASDPAGLNLQHLLDVKRAGAGVAALAGGLPGQSGPMLAATLDYDLLLEATPVNLRHGDPGLRIVRTALGRGIDSVLANKAPLALAFAELARLGSIDARRDGGPLLRFSACVGGALPTINLGIRDLAGATIERVEAVVNGTTQGILRAMESGVPYDAALAQMQRAGLAETDPALDVDGWDAANKLVIIANAVLRQPATLADLTIEGIRAITPEHLRAARARGERIVLLGLADRAGARYRLSVAPTALADDHPLARMGADEMGVVYTSDISGRQFATSREHDPQPTAAAMLRDVIEIARQPR
ncbi:MAG: homoserine dehydrogenase [Chloroflexi bacterium]|nr:homoserine dehydrogenase [Chloroflexota bacterium]